MFPGVKVESLLKGDVYLFPERDDIYLKFLKYFIDLYDYPRAITVWNQSTDEERSGRLWRIVNEAWESYSKINENLPVIWLATAKKALEWDHMPVNFHPWALAILEHFDLERYHAAYHLPRDEYEAIAHDLPIVLEGLRNYPTEKLAAPIDEDNWGYIDY